MAMMPTQSSRARESWLAAVDCRQFPAQYAATTLQTAIEQDGAELLYSRRNIQTTARQYT
jgi:hypothetical protein